MNVFITLLITGLILYLCFLSLKKNSVRNYKNEIVSLGVLGTFIGILIGLLNFDTNNIEQSLPYFLGGLKTAFITSGIGMLCSIIIAILKPANSRKTDDINNANTKVTLEHISNNQREMIETLKKSINDIANSANAEIIVSLEQVVKQFNSQLNEQFGQNFTELNNAVKELNAWQHNYKNQIGMHDESIKVNFEQVQNMSKINARQEKNIEGLISHLSNTTHDINKSLKKSTDIVEENLQLLLREANACV